MCFSLKKLKVDVLTKQLIDSDLNYVILHGVNVAYKNPPYIPTETGKFDFKNSFSNEDALILKNLGMNFIRLTFYWEGVEPERSKYDEEYLNKIEEIIKICEINGIYVLLDLHQDSASKKFCGEGMPDWAVEDGESFLTKFPSPLFWIKLDRDEKGYPTQESCIKRDFGIYYKTYEVENAFHNLFSNHNGIGDNFKLMWMHVAKRFKDYENIIGYEIINEPFIGNIYKNPLIVIQKDFVMNFYRKVNDGIREIDKESIIFYESPATDDVFNTLKGTPGGEEYNDRQIYSYHVYGSSGDPTDLRQANRNCRKSYDFATKKMNQENVLGMLTEFGAISGKESISIENMNFVLDLADIKLHSWAYWQYKFYNDYTTAARPSEWEGFFDDKGNFIESKVKALARPFISFTSIILLKSEFDTKKMQLNAEFKNVSKNNVFSTTFNISSKYYSNFTADFQNCIDCKLTKKDKNSYVLNHSNVKVNDSFSVQISFEEDN